MTLPIVTLSRERLENLASGDAFYCIQDDEGKELARALLAVMDAQEKPLGYVDQRVIDSEDGNGGMWVKRQSRQENFYSVPVYTTPTAPSAPDGWIKCSDRMPAARHEVLVGCYWGNGFAKKWATYIPGHPDAQSSGWLLPGASWTPTHWHELPTAPESD